MKNLITSAFIIMALSFLTSCSKKESEQIISQSPNQKIEILVKATTYSMFDPWSVSISVRQVGHERLVASVTQEIMSKEITQENVKFEWVNDTQCKLRITQTDGSIIKVPISVELN